MCLKLDVLFTSLKVQTRLQTILASTSDYIQYWCTSSSRKFVHPLFTQFSKVRRKWRYIALWEIDKLLYSLPRSKLCHTFSENILTFPRPWPSAATLEPLSSSGHRRTRPDLQQAQRPLGAPGSLNWDGYGRSCLASLMVARTRPVSVCLSVGPAEDTALNTRVRPAGRNRE